MSFRNDHDAAMARIDALEHENRVLLDENAKLRRAAATTTVKTPPAPTKIRKPTAVVAPASRFHETPFDTKVLTMIGLIIIGVLMIAAVTAP